LISQKTIDDILQIPIEKVVGKEIELQRAGANYKGVCPFHDDKSPSMTVSPTKGIYMCFACGAGGGPIKFITEKKGYDFPEAVKYLGENHGVTLEYEKEENPLTQVAKDTRAVQATLVADAQQLFLQALRDSTEAIEYVKSRQITGQMAKYFDLGYAPTGNILRAQYLKEGNLDAALEIGLCRTGSKASYDAYQDRITIPIHDHTGRLLGWGGRVTPTNDSQAKYVNPSDSWLYKKERILYNLNRAIPHIKDAKRTVYLTEGYLDVIGLNRIGIKNAVASCGTAFTIEQAKLLKRFADHVYLFFDGDNAGRKATFKAAEICITLGFRISVINILDADPDDLSCYTFNRFASENTKITKENKLSPEDSAADLDQRLVAYEATEMKQEKKHFLDWAYEQVCSPLIEYSFLKNKTTIALLPTLRKHAVIIAPVGSYIAQTNLKIEPLLEGVKFSDEEIPLDPDEEQIIREKFLSYVKLFPEMAQSDWTKKLCKLWGYDKQTIKAALKSSADIVLTRRSDLHIDAEVSKIPKDCDQKFLLQNGFAPKKDNSGYYFQTQTGGFQKAGNFVLKPLFHVYGRNNQRYVEVSNHNRTQKLLLDSGDMATIDRLHNKMWNEGGFVAGAITKHQYIQLLEYWGHQFPKCRELTTLGWQDEGFFAYSNRVFNGELGNFDELGIYHFDKQKYLSPSTVENFLDLRDSEKQNQNDNYLEYKESPVELEAFLQMYRDVYKDRAVIGIGFIMLSVFRDIAIQSGSIPLLYCYGNTTAGKSAFIESITGFFFSGKSTDGKMMKPYQVSSGTAASRYAYMERFTNTMIAYNEVDVHTCGEDIIKEFKGVYDGEGRSKMDGFSKRSITSYAKSCIALIGQFLYTGDEGSVVNRSILEKFGKPKFTQEEKDSWTELNKVVEDGVSSLVCDFLKHRKLVESKYPVAYSLCNKELRTETGKHTKTMNSRLINNYAHILALYKLIGDVIALPFTYEYVWDKVVNDILEQNDQFTEFSVVNEFWDKVANMLAYRDIKINQEVKLESITSTLIKARKNKTETVNFSGAKDVLFINMSAFHEKYKINARKTGDVPMAKDNLSKHIKDHDAFLGTVPVTAFSEGARTSAYMFDIEKLPTDLSQYFQESDTEVESPIQELELYVCGPPEITERAAVKMLKFKAEKYLTLGKYETYQCVTNKLDIVLDLQPQTKMVAKGEVRVGSFVPKGQAEKVEWQQFIISEIKSLTPPEVKQESMDFEEGENPM
jgi:DNA primase